LKLKGVSAPFEIRVAAAVDDNDFDPLTQQSLKSFERFVFA